MKSIFCNCSAEQNIGAEKIKGINKIVKVGSFDKSINESSGLEVFENSLLTHNDSGDGPYLYETDFKGSIKNKINISDAKNIDWEDIAQDEKGRLFIGDFGNNALKRKDQKIYVYQNGITESINFNFGDGLENFDCEAMFYFNDNLYLITKNWTKAQSNMFVIPAKPGSFTAKKVDSYTFSTPVTAADISPDNKQFAVLTMGKVIIFEIGNAKPDFKNPIYCIKTRRKQTEGLVYRTDKQLLFSNEQKKIYEIKLK